MAKQPTGGLGRHWYKVSEDTIRGCGLIVLTLVLVGVAILSYQAIRPYLDRQDAARIIQESRGLARRIELEETIGSFDSELLTANDALQSAENYYADGKYHLALTHAQRSRSILTWIADALLHHRLAGEAQFISVKGRVEFRRGNRGEWRPVAGRDLLRSGDFVKTSGSGLAEIIFDDGTLYTVRPNTLFVVTRGRDAAEDDDERAIAMEYGWVNLNTSQRASKVETPGAEARLGSESEGLVSYDQATDTGRFATYRGTMAVTSDRAQRDVGALQEVTLEAKRLSQPRQLPARPYLLAPEDNFEVSLGSRDRVVLRWSPVEAATRYALQVSRSRLFVDNIVDVDDRIDTRVSVGLRGEGTFVWRVAAYNKDGRQGPWSAMQRFRVAAGAPGSSRHEALSGPEVQESELGKAAVGGGDG